MCQQRQLDKRGEPEEERSAGWDNAERAKQVIQSIKCIDKNISRLPNECALLDSLYGDETTTSDNIASMVKISQSSKPVTLAVANLYLRQQIIFERV